jgi:hypothetical protein
MATFLWTQKQDMGPSPRCNHDMTFDPVRQKVMLFGGAPQGTRFLHDTWEWDGEYWIQIADTGPAPRVGHALAFDSVGKRIILFGGGAASMETSAHNPLSLVTLGSGKTNTGLNWTMPVHFLACRTL